jgi:nicotinamide mononucleotide transporter
MNFINTLFSVDSTFFTILNYPMSYIEFFGTLANLACVWLIAKKNILSWPVGIVGVVLFAALFYQINLYADLLEQFYYFITGIAGWYVWARRSNKEGRQDNQEIEVVVGAKQDNIKLLLVAIFGSLILSYTMLNIHVWLPALFPEKASLVVPDAITTVVSFIAQYLLIKKRLESWVLWISVDVVAVWLYWYKGVPFVSLLYLVFLFMAIDGFRTWLKTYNNQKGR